MTDGLRYRHGLLEVGKLSSHDAAHGVFRVVQKLVDEFAGLRTGDLEHPLDHVGRELLQHVHCVVYIQLFHNGGELLVGDGLQHALLLLGGEVGEHLRCQLLGQGTKGQYCLLLGQRLQKQCDVHGVFLRQRCPQSVEIPALEQLLQQFKILLHVAFLLCSNG